MDLRTIDDVVHALDDIIEDCHGQGSRLGYFPAMYRKTTLEVKRGLETGRFHDPERMERLDVVFARRYLDAYRTHRQGGRPTEAWRYAFAMGNSHRPGVIHHLLLGMNAHINLDLGISAVEVAPGQSLLSLKRDFDEINDILGELVDGVQDDLGSLFPLLRALDFLCLRLDEVAVHLAVRRARSTAWDKAVTLSGLQPDEDRTPHIASFDREALTLAETICPPGHLGPHREAVPPLDAEPGDTATVQRIIEALVD